MNTNSTLLSKDDVSWFCWDDPSNDSKTSYYDDGQQKTSIDTTSSTSQSKNSRNDSVGQAGDVNLAANKTNRCFEDYYPNTFPARTSNDSYPAPAILPNTSSSIHSSTNPYCFSEDTITKQYEQHYQHYQHSDPCYSCQQQYDSAADWHTSSTTYPRSAPGTYQQEGYHQHQHSYYNSSIAENPGSTSTTSPPCYQWPAPTLTRSLSITSNQAQNTTYDASFWHGEAMVSPYSTTSGDFADYAYHSRRPQQHRRVSQTSSLYSYGGEVEKEPKRKLKKPKVADDEPRRPLSAYNFYFSEEKEIVVALLPDKQEENATDAGDIQLCDMDVDKIQEYLIEAKRKLSTEALAALSETVERQTERTLLAHLEGDKPKKLHKKRHGKISFQKLASVIGRRWRDLSDDDKKRYFALVKADEDRFKKQKEQLEERTATSSTTSTRSSGSTRATQC